MFLLMLLLLGISVRSVHGKKLSQRKLHPVLQLWALTGQPGWKERYDITIYMNLDGDLEAKQEVEETKITDKGQKELLVMFPLHHILRQKESCTLFVMNRIDQMELC